MTDKPSDHLSNPIDEREGSRPFGQPVIDLADIRVAHGLPRFYHQRCEHRSMVYSSQERRVWCKDCEATVDGFDAFMTMADHFHKMELAAQRRLDQAKEALASTLVKRASKQIDKAWNRAHPMAVHCPHCKGGLLAEDFENGTAMTSRDIELARRARNRSTE